MFKETKLYKDSSPFLKVWTFNSEGGVVKVTFQAFKRNGEPIMDAQEHMSPAKQARDYFKRLQCGGGVTTLEELDT